MTLQELHDRTGELLKTQPPESDILLAFRDCDGDDLACDLENLEVVPAFEVLGKYGLDYEDDAPTLVLNHNATQRGE